MLGWILALPLPATQLQLHIINYCHCFLSVRVQESARRLVEERKIELDKICWLYCLIMFLRQWRCLLIQQHSEQAIG